MERDKRIVICFVIFFSVIFFARIGCRKAAVDNSLCLGTPCFKDYRNTEMSDIWLKKHDRLNDGMEE